MKKNNVFHLWAILALTVSLCTTSSLEAQITGSVFRDYNGNGTQDANEPFMPGVIVNAYDATNALCGTATTVGGNSAPNYSLTGCGTGAVRVEFVLPSNETFVAEEVDFPSLSGTTYGTSVQFVNGNSANVNYALHDPDDFNTGPGDVTNYIPCYINGDPLPPGSPSGALDWFVGYPNTARGNDPIPQKMGGSVIGATWGVAYSKYANRIFTSAFIKRHVGLGVLGSGGIYMLEPTATSFNATPFYDLDANGHRTRAAATAVPYGEGSSFQVLNSREFEYLGPIDPITNRPEGAGVVGVNGPTGRNLPTDVQDPSYDVAAYGQVGKAGLGGLELSDDGRYLFVMNLFTRSVFRLELDDVYNPTSVVSVTEIPLPTVSCNNGELRPFALTYDRGKLFAGAVCTGENGGARADMFAYVFEMDNANTGTVFNATPVVSQSLDYNKGDNVDNCGSSFVWHVWSDDIGDAQPPSSPSDYCYSQPLFTDLTFGNNGQMILSFSGRIGHMFALLNYSRFPPGTNLIGAFEFDVFASGGELMVAGLDAATGNYQMEFGGNLTSNGIALTSNNNADNSFRDDGGVGAAFFSGPRREFFTGDNAGGGLFREITIGSSAYLPGEEKVHHTAFDPLCTFCGGVRLMSINDGAWENDQEHLILYEASSGAPNWGKADGLGELEFSGVEAPLEIGNRVWLDTNEDGIQDPDEAGIPGVVVELWKDDGAGNFTQIATVITDTDGGYFFTSATGTSLPGITYGVDMLLPEMNYELRFPATATVGPDVFSLTVADMGGTDPNADARDSDADPAGVVPFMTAGVGANDHSFDVGYRVAVANLEMEKTFVSATPNNDGTFTVDYTITVTETGGAATTYDLTDTPGFDDDVTINSGGVTGQATITFGSPTNGTTETLATNEPIIANEIHTYNLSFNVTLDLMGGGGDNIYTPCDGTTPTAGQGLYNLATITTAGMSGDDDDCGDLSVITHEKALTSVSTINGDGSYDVVYTITVSHLAGIAGQYDLNDIPNFDDDFTINNANFTSSAPPGLSGPLSTTMGATNILGDDVPIAIGATHTYTLNFNVSLDLTDGAVGDDVFTSCGATTGTPQAGEGLFNQSTLDLNNDGTPEEIREVCSFDVCPSGNCGDISVSTTPAPAPRPQND